MRIVIQNGLCLVATWLTIATLFNLADVMIYKSSFGINPAIERGKMEHGQMDITDCVTKVFEVPYVYRYNHRAFITGKALFGSGPKDDLLFHS